VPWRRLVINCHCDGRLSAWADPGGDRRWLRRGLAAVTAGCLIASAVLFAAAWRWSPPPRADVIPLPPPPARQQEAFDVISKWYDAENRSDVAGMRSLNCANPGKDLADRAATIQYHGNYQADVYPDAITSFIPDGAHFKAEVMARSHPLDAHMKWEAQWVERDGGFSYEKFVLIDEGGYLKICDIDMNNR
jgi:hypothetical protein